jgi:hypothetical protein
VPGGEGVDEPAGHGGPDDNWRDAGAPEVAAPSGLCTFRGTFVTVSEASGSSSPIPDVDVSALSAWAGDHVVLLVLAGAGLLILGAVVAGRSGDLARPVLNVVLGLGLIAGAAALYGYADPLMDLFSQR